LLVHLSQAVEGLGLKKEPNTHVVPLERALQGNVKVRFFEVSSREFGHFENISNALSRLDQGSYGWCTRCGAPIQAELLAEMPWADWCLSCEDQAQP